MNPDNIDALSQFMPVIALVVIVPIGGWVLTTWMRVRHGYPLEGSEGKPVYPLQSAEAEERIRLLTQENAQLRAEIGSLKDRLATIERIVTDGSYRLDREIETLRGPAN
jgi:hypothetical protein